MRFGRAEEISVFAGKFEAEEFDVEERLLEPRNRVVRVDGL
jgi:hypothetical protein